MIFSENRFPLFGIMLYCRRWPFWRLAAFSSNHLSRRGMPRRHRPEGRTGLPQARARRRRARARRQPECGESKEQPAVRESSSAQFRAFFYPWRHVIVLLAFVVMAWRGFAWLCRHHPLAAIFLVSFLRGLLGGGR